MRPSQHRRRPPSWSWCRPAAACLLTISVVGVTTIHAWSPSSSRLPTTSTSAAPRSSVCQRTTTAASPLSSTTEAVDETYYSPSWNGSIDSSSNPPTTSTTSTSATTSEELEVAARNYGSSAQFPPGAKITLTRWLSAKVQDYPELRDMESLHLSIQMACKTISNLIHSSNGVATGGGRPVLETEDGGVTMVGIDNASGSMRDNSMKRLDQISKNVLQNALRFTGRLRVVEAPRTTPGRTEDGPKTHQPGVTIAYALDQYGKDGVRSNKQQRSGVVAGGGGLGGTVDVNRAADVKWGRTRRLAACFDPLDGSGNADASICTGTVFGVFDADAGFKGGESPDLRDPLSLSRAVLQPGNKLLAAGYCLYSSTTMLVFTLGGGTHGFTLDQSINEFVLTHPNMKIPKRGNIYSANEAYSEGWNPKFKAYLKALKTGRGETKQRYTQRYIGSMVGDVHRTLMYGGIFCCPSDSEVHHKGNLQLVYKSAPMAYILEHAGGKASNGIIDLLKVQPEYVHERSPCFMGSPEDMDELMRYLGKGEGDDLGDDA